MNKELQNKLDEKILRIQKSTKTLFKFLIPLHDRLRLRFRWYYIWHLNPYFTIYHLLMLIVYLVGTVVLGIVLFSQKPQTYAIQPQPKETSLPVPKAALGRATLFYLDFEDSSSDKQNRQKALKEKNINFLPGKFGKGGYFKEDAILKHEVQNRLDLERGTIEFWFKPDWQGSDEGYFYLVCANDQGNLPYKSEYNVLKIVRSYEKMLLFEIHDDKGNAAWAETSTSDWQKDVWYHIAATWEAETKTIALYVNGELKDQKTNLSYFPSKINPYIFIGNADFGKVASLGTLDELVIKNFVASPSEIREGFLEKK